uniref:Plancitoxin-1-like isoform X2 n=1 Tax=Crassostrea virginica TaxID=6565 RepID=A0A8B8DDF0_CRAVI|nr:plancitoxin-1-like isoform X2 [Crassostrea virginica]
MKGVLTFVTFLISLRIVDCVQCKSQNGDNVDWFIMYKVPYKTKSSDGITKGTEFFYTDAKIKHSDIKYMYIDIDLNQSDQNPLYKTLEPIYRTDGLPYIMYNDQPPVKNEKMNWKNAHRPRGHSKGVTAFDNETGFWIISSVPRFPTVASEGYQFMANQTRFGQTILCITFRSENVKKEIKQVFEVVFPYIYDKRDVDGYIPMKRKEKSAHIFPIKRLGERPGHFWIFAKSEEIEQGQCVALSLHPGDCPRS